MFSVKKGRVTLCNNVARWCCSNYISLWLHRQCLAGSNVVFRCIDNIKHVTFTLDSFWLCLSWSWKYVFFYKIECIYFFLKDCFNVVNWFLEKWWINKVIIINLGFKRVNLLRQMRDTERKHTSATSISSNITLYESESEHKC